MKQIITFCLLILLFSCNEKPTLPGFAIIIDNESYQNAKTEVDAYAASVEAGGLKTFIVVDKWKQPDSIKAQLVRMHSEDAFPIEGAVFIGDIPIPMLRDAQHLTSAFKMDQDRYPWNRSSVPSDRFYDDFDLDFEFLKEDSLHQNYFYYSLKAESGQKLQPEIYTARIKPFETIHKYKDLKNYLKKVVDAKLKKQKVDQLLFFGGHGYISESMLARIDEKVTLLDQFPWMKGQQNGMGYIDHTMDDQVKPRLMSELQRKDLDIAILHHHGGDDMQYLSGIPKVDNVNKQIDGVKYYLRSKMRSAKRHGKTEHEAKHYYQEKLGVPTSWFEGSFDEETIKKDSIFNAGLDISISDAKEYTPNARFVMLDACFNGSFHLDSSLSAAYIFNSGNTLATQANSVNALQDKWANELVGLLGLGVRLGNWAKHVCYLETHIIGDPTLQFLAPQDVIDINKALFEHSEDNHFWIYHLGTDYADIQSLALRKLFENNYTGLTDLLLRTFKRSHYATVRMECLKLLTAFNDDNFIECLTLACDDSNEFIQRQAVYLISKSGDERLLAPMLKIAMRNNTAARLEFNIKQALSTYSKDDILETFPILFDSLQHFTKPNEVKAAITHSLEYNAARWENTAKILFDPEVEQKKKKFNIRLLRNYNYHPGVEEFCEFVKKSEDEKLQVMMLEALGWFNVSHKKDTIIITCDKIIESNSYSQDVKNEAMLTKNRLVSSWYR